MKFLSAAVAALLLAAPATAELDFDVHADGVPWSVHWNITAQDVTLAIEGNNSDALDVFIGIGGQNTTAPREWYVLAISNATHVIDGDGGRPDVHGHNGTWHWARGNATAGDCIVVVARTWQRVDHQQQTIATIPEGADILAPWGAGDRCHVQDGVLAVASGDKKSPAGMLGFLALGAVLWLRRR